MELGITDKKLSHENLVNSLIKNLKSKEALYNLNYASLFNEFPIYKDLDEEIVIAQILIVSKSHGVILIHVDDSTSRDDFNEKESSIEEELDNLFSILFTRTLRNKKLRKSKRDLNFPINSIVYAPLIENYQNSDSEFSICTSEQDLQNFFTSHTTDQIDEELYSEIKSTIEGSKAISKTKNRGEVVENSKGDAANQLEKEISSFDQYQRSAYTSPITGVSRVRGLAGSGKTVVLAIKAALTHLKHPNAKLVYTFHTKSLHQHIKRLITRFYRQFEDNDPNWDNLDIIHAWGSSYNPGVYYNACRANEIPTMSFSIASGKSSNAFDYVCKSFLESRESFEKVYDYVFIDEGQDFPPSFLKLCLAICEGSKIIWAYDELQTIFLPNSPSARDIFGENEKGEPKIDFDEDIILYKCYRNPREILVIAHALGFGIYGERIVQMIESEEYWNDIGYDIKKGSLKEGSELEIERASENSLESVSKRYSIDELIRVNKYKDYSKELYSVASMIDADIKEGLLPEDILVITVDDRNASKYLRDIQEILGTKYKIGSNNIHADKYAVKDFQMDGKVTLSTVHKAKGNEAYSVYIVGSEALFSTDPTIKERNILFTAVTRSKAWVAITGIGDNMDFIINEVKDAKNNFPYLKFKYPSSKDLKVMKRDIKDQAIRKSKSKKMIENALSTLSPDEIKRYVDQLSEEKKKS
ncbi:DEAD/DEAH box helicase [Roseivirga thermotolerans]|uniref:DNA 3'-5' helicase II n=1 Tax=Roseivirga thermotolerans TaxID=1758176 RepID=A0ABQ3I8G6_9BACT|nr:ATP-binding domain-containing protein [Roseivirga thermotolerans]GHE67751.1 hypothetical protein GCM10011340_24150 [Roseivirga thermotolerans]